MREDRIEKLQLYCAKAEVTRDARRLGRSCSRLPRARNKEGNGVTSAFPKGKQSED